MKRVRVLAVVAVAVVALIAASDPASATISSKASFLGAGYKSTPAGGVSSAKVKFVVPSVTCHDNTSFEGLYLGVTSLNSIGERTAYAAAYIACNSSLTPDYFGVAYTADGGFQQLSIAIGDVLVASMDETGTTTTATIRNLTDKTKQTSATSAAKDPSVLLGDFGEPTVPTFSRVQFKEAKVNGLPVATDITPVVRQQLKWNTDLQITTTLISSGATQFVIAFKNNS